MLEYMLLVEYNRKRMEMAVGGAGEISLVHWDTLHYREKKNTTGKTKVQYVWTKTSID